MIFNYNEQLVKQDTISNLTQTQRGSGKVLMGVLGYNALGEQNAWGKRLAMNSIGVGAGIRHRIATGAADGTSKDVMRDTQDEASAMAWSKAALAFNIAKTAGGGGFGGAGSGAGVGKIIDGVEAGSGIGNIGSGIDNLTGATQFGDDKAGVKGFIQDMFSNKGMRNEIEELNQRVMGDSMNPGASNAIGDMLNGDLIGSIGNAIVGTSNYLKSDEEALRKVISGNTGSQTMNYL